MKILWKMWNAITVNHISVYEGDASLLTDQQIYDVIIANINRNILLADMPTYSKVLKKEGTLLLSGFYVEDIPAIEEMAQINHLKRDITLERNNWVGLRYLKV
jgi:ribosomal protein L11 methyltransferase